MQRMNSIEFLRVDDELSVQVRVSPEPLTAADLRAQFSQSPFGRWQINQQWLETLLDDYQTCVHDVLEQRLPEGYLLERRLAVRKNANVSFQIADDLMVVKAVITAAWGGQPISANELVKLAQEAGVTFGFQRDQIIALVSAASRAEPGTQVPGVVAIGRVMQPGGSSRLEPLVEGLRPRLQRPVTHDEQAADLRDFGVLPSVHAGEPILRRVPPSPGIDGVNVKGQVQTAPIGQLVPWQLGEGVGVSPQDPDVIIATRDGMPRLADNSAYVDEIYAVKRVDLSTGHIQFKGSVIINGDVTESMKVIAGGNIYIKGTVEGSLIEAGGDIEIGGAIIGHQLQESEQKLHAQGVHFIVKEHYGDAEVYSTVVRASGNISCSFAQYAAIEAGGFFHAMKQLHHCHVNAQSVLVGKTDKPSGKVVGGSFMLEQTLTAGAIGSPSESRLLVSFNRKIQPVLERLVSLRQTAQSIRQEMEEIRRGVEAMRQMEKSESSQVQIQMLVQEFDSQKKILLALTQDIKQLEQLKSELMLQPALLARQQIFVGVDVRIGEEVYLVKQEHSGTKIAFDGSHIVLEPWSGN